MRIAIQEIQVKEGRRSPDGGHVKELADSIQEFGLLNPITIDQGNVLIAGLHRLEAVKTLGWTEVECTVSSLEGLQAEMAEIDENFIRNNLSPVEYGEMLLRRKEIYEALHPETKATYEGGSFRGNQYQKVVADKMSATTKSFVKDSAEKLGITPRTVRRQIQTAKNLTPEAKEIIKTADTKFSKKAVTEISGLEPDRQKEAAALLAAKEIKTVDEYKTRKRRSEESRTRTFENVAQDVAQGRPRNAARIGKPEIIDARGTKEIVAELKNPDKDCSGTPDSFLEEYGVFVKKFHKEIGWYDTSYYDAVFPLITPGQLARLRDMTDSICSAAEELFHKVESRRNVIT